MAETSNIARMAAKVSDNIFDIFGWTRVGPVDQNWSCVTDAHGKATHPSDAVFWYDDPYRRERVIWNVDLKSYAAGSITRTQLAGAISSLARSVECANVSRGWQELYADNEDPWRCDGLLFVYNHDGEFDKDFPSLLADVDLSHFRIAARRRMAIVGPTDVAYLVNVANDITLLRGRKQIPLDEHGLEYWYPDMVRPKLRPQHRSAATIEMLTGPWMTVLIPPEHNNGKRKFLVYHRESGGTVEEFKYMLDSFFRFQMLAIDREAAIEVRLVHPDRVAIANFGRAKDAIATSLYGLAKGRLEHVKCESISDIQRRFGEIDLGMEAR